MCPHVDHITGAAGTLSSARPAATATSSLRLSDLAAPVHHQVEALRCAVVRALEKRRHVLRDLDRGLRLVDS